MKKLPRHAPKRIESGSDLVRLQRLMAATMMRPLSQDDGLRSKWVDGRPMEDVAAEFVKPNDRLTAFERLEIYAKSYWFRLFDAIRDDCPGLIAVLGEERFMRLAQAYLAAMPSRSYTLRNLCARLPGFIASHPRLCAPPTALALDVARFEWAQTVAFDGEALPTVEAAYFQTVPADRLRLGIQPYVTLLDLRYPVDTFLMRIKRSDALRADASNAPIEYLPSARRGRRVVLPRPSRTYVAVHRMNNRLFYKRLDPRAYAVLAAIAGGSSVAEAVAKAGRGTTPAQMKNWFKVWMALGWFCRRSAPKSATHPE